MRILPHVAYSRSDPLIRRTIYESGPARPKRIFGSLTAAPADEPAGIPGAGLDDDGGSALPPSAEAFSDRAFPSIANTATMTNFG
jgi:hypothetical protein